MSAAEKPVQGSGSGRGQRRFNWSARRTALTLMGIHILAMLLWRFGGRLGLFEGGGGGGFFANPWHAANILLAAAAAIAAGVVALDGVIRRRERSVVLYLIVLYALFVAAFGIGEVLAPH